MSIRGSREYMLAICLAGALWSQTAGAIELEQAIWGFGGEVRGDQITLLSVLLRNNESVPFDGVVRLSGSRAQSALGGTVLEEEVFIGPNSSRWVQYYPYIPATEDEWTLRCSRTESFDLPQIQFQRSQQPASPPTNSIVWLQAEGTLSTSGGGFLRLPAELFPAKLAGTDELNAVIMNEDPRWDQPRRDTFLRWLYRGGTVHLFHAPDGKLPSFSTDMQVLNGTEAEHRIGQGKVIRHAQNLSGTKISDLLPPTKPDPEGESQELHPNGIDIEQGKIFRTLRSLVAPQHQWPLIWVAAGVYLLLIFPGGYLVGRFKRDFRLVMGAQIGAALLFTFLFSVIGSRGYNESSRNLMIGIARPVSADQWSLNSWNSVFATNGGDYRITYPKRGGVLGTGVDQNQTLRGVINNGVDAAYLVDIPPFSSCTFLARQVFNSPEIQARLTNWDPATPLSLECQTTANWPAEITRGFVYIHPKLYQMSSIKGGLKVQHEIPGGTLTPNWGWQPQIQSPPQGTDLSIWLEDQLTGLEQTILKMEIARRQAVGDAFENRIVLFLPASIPDSCYPDSGVSGKPVGRMLYCLDLPTPASK